MMLRDARGFKQDYSSTTRKENFIRFAVNNEHNPLLTSVLSAISNHWELVSKIFCEKDPLTLLADEAETKFKVRLFNKSKNNFEICIVPAVIIKWCDYTGSLASFPGEPGWNLWPWAIETALIFWTKNMRDLYYLLENPNNLFTALTGMGCIIYNTVSSKESIASIIEGKQLGRIVMCKLNNMGQTW